MDTREIMMLSANLWRVITDRKEEISPEGKDTRNGVGFFLPLSIIHLSIHASILPESRTVLGIENQQGMTSLGMVEWGGMRQRNFFQDNSVLLWEP